MKIQMPLFIAYHKWHKEQTKLAAKKVIEALGNAWRVPF